MYERYPLSARTYREVNGIKRLLKTISKIDDFYSHQNQSESNIKNFQKHSFSFVINSLLTILDVVGFRSVNSFYQFEFFFSKN